MSLVKLAMRMAAVEALKGKTLVGDVVLDSEIGVIDLKPDGTLESEQEKRFIAVYTQEGKLELDAHMPRALHEGGTCELIFEIGITASMTTRDPETGDQEVIEGIPATDAAFEFYLDVVDRQILDALTTGSSAWSEIWRGLVPRVISVHRQRTDSAGQVRLAGHQLKLNCEIAADPTPGHAYDPDGPFGQFMSALTTSPIVGHQVRAALMTNVLEATPGASWQAVMHQLGLTRAEAEALGHAPLASDEPDAEVDAAILEVAGSGSVTVETDPEA